MLNIRCKWHACAKVHKTISHHVWPVMTKQYHFLFQLQDFFEYVMATRCGIPAVEMLGTEDDWIRLGKKLEALKEILKPIQDDIGLLEQWWSHARKVFKKLLKTFQGKPDKSWWDKIIHYEGARGSGQVSGYTGWITQFIEGSSERIPPRNFSSGLVTVPLIIKRFDGVQDTAALVAGMLGFTFYDQDWPVVQPYQGWSLLLPENSPFRSKNAA